mmetsp:Transcript_12224/g.33748  ORF Transcript_12224/g.33748 Transcript_12224/m.33748 type:complete len:86 (+) Transcript_12224:61-318(+)
MKIEVEDMKICSDMNKSAADVLDDEEGRLRESVQATGDPFAMAALGRFLRFKRGNIAEANEWQRMAVDAVAGNLSSNLDPVIRYC